MSSFEDFDRRHPNCQSVRRTYASATAGAIPPRGTEPCGILGYGNSPGGCKWARLTCKWAAAEIARMKRFFVILAENADVQPEWERLVVQHSVSGKKVHDARLVATVNVHQVSRILTFNADDFFAPSGADGDRSIEHGPNPRASTKAVAQLPARLNRLLFASRSRFVTGSFLTDLLRTRNTAIESGLEGRSECYAAIPKRL
jgi:hypothetical protein